VPPLIRRFEGRHRLHEAAAEVAHDAHDAQPRLLLHRVVRVFALGHAQFFARLEDQQLIDSGERVLTCDVNDDARPASQLCWARIFALYARFASW
jgi:hypothetical protein